MTVAVTRFSTPGASGNQDITTTDLGGLTPKAVMFIASRATSDGVADNNAIIGVGAATSSTERWAFCTVSDHSETDTNTVRRGRGDACIYVVGTGGGATVRADFVQFITNGCRVNYTGSPGSGEVTAVFFAGGISAYAGRFSPGTTVGAGVDVTAPGFQPDLVLFGSFGQEFDNTAYDHHRFCVGAAVDDGSDTQMCVLQREDDALTASAVNARLTSNRAVRIRDTGSDWECQIGTFDSQGFTSTLRLVSAGTAEVGYLALSLGVGLYLGVHDTPTSTGNQASTAAGFNPQVLLFMLSYLTTVDTTATAGNAGSVGVSASSSSSQYSTSISIEDGADPTNTQSLIDSKSVNLPSDDGSTGLEADFVSFDTTGWTLDFTQVLGSARKFVALAVEESAGLPEREYPRGVSRGVLRGVR